MENFDYLTNNADLNSLDEANDVVVDVIDGGDLGEASLVDLLESLGFLPVVNDDDDEIDELLQTAIADADLITERLIEIVFEYGLLEEFEPAEAVKAAYDVWTASREIAAGVVSADLSLKGIPLDLTFVGQNL